MEQRRHISPSFEQLHPADRPGYKRKSPYPRRRNSELRTMLSPSPYSAIQYHLLFRANASGPAQGKHNHPKKPGTWPACFSRYEEIHSACLKQIRQVKTSCWLMLTPYISHFPLLQRLCCMRYSSAHSTPILFYHPIKVGPVRLFFPTVLPSQFPVFCSAFQ